jgi:glycosyltransferase involved in cell wall biosynthesis
MRITHLTASTMFGGPERQMLGLAHHLPTEYRTNFISFAEGGRCRAFLAEVKRCGFDGEALGHDTPRLFKAARELAERLADAGADVVCCHGYKANLVGRLAARRLEIPAVAVSRGWTGESPRVRLYERLDRWHLRWMDHVVCVSHAQARRVRQCGVEAARISVMHNAIRVSRLSRLDWPWAQARRRLEGLFTWTPAIILGAAGRLSPEKGFDLFVRAAKRLSPSYKKVGFVLFGDGTLRQRLARQVQAAGLETRLVLAGHRTDLDSLLPGLDGLVLPSWTEGLPNVVLEAFAASVPVVATAVGGTPEVVDDAVSGLLVPAGDAIALADACRELIDTPTRRRAMGRAGRKKVLARFTFEAQAKQYCRLFERWRPASARERRRAEVVA